MRRSPACDLLRLYRVRDWVHILPLPLATFDPQAPRSSALLAAARGVASAFAMLAFGFLLNSVSDRHVDLNACKNPLIDAGAGGYQYSLAVLLGVILVLTAFSPWPAQLAVLSCLALGCVYSIGPRLKSVPIASSLANAAGFTLMLFFGMATASLPYHFGYVAWVFAALLLQNQLIHEAGDRIEDHAGGIRTTWLMLGPRWTALIATLSGLGAMTAAVCIVPRLWFWAMVTVVGLTFVIAFPMLLAWRGLDASQAARLRVIHRWCAVLLGAVLYVAWRSEL